MNVLEKILEEIREIEKKYVVGHNVLFALGATGMATEISGIIRSHMDEEKDDGWISVKKRLPEGKEVIAQNKDGEMLIGYVYYSEEMERKEPKKMTVEEMQKKLEELTGEEIEVTA